MTGFPKPRQARSTSERTRAWRGRRAWSRAVWVRRAGVRVTSKPRAWSWRMWLRDLAVVVGAGLRSSPGRGRRTGPRGWSSRCQMMTRMERATATWALACPRRRAMRWRSARRGRWRCRPRRWRPGRGSRAGRCRPVLSCRRRDAGAGLAGRRAEPGPGHQVGGGGEPGHVQAGLGDDRAGQLGADAGDLREPLRGGQHGGVRAGAGAGAGGAVGVDAPGGRDRGRSARSIRAARTAIRASQEGDLVQQHLGQLAVVVIEHPGQRLDQGVVLGFHLAAGQAGQGTAGHARRRSSP